MTLFMYAYTPPEGEIWTDEAVAQLVGKSPTATGLAGRYSAGEIVAAQRRGLWPDRELHVTVSMPDDVLLPLPADYEEVSGE